jgi:hypothetical protein
MSLVVPCGWRELSVSNDRLSVRGGRASCISRDGKFLVLFGGCDPFGVASNQLHLVELQTGRGELAKILNDGTQALGSPPGGRSGACIMCLPAAAAGEEASNAVDVVARVLIYGGASFLPAETVYDEVWIGTVRRKATAAALTVHWCKVENGCSEGSKAVPLARHSFASCLVDDNGEAEAPVLSLFVFGGSSRNSTSLASPAFLDLSPLLLNAQPAKLEWTACESAVALPTTEMCSACYVPSLGTVFFTGGTGSSNSAPPSDLFACRIISQKKNAAASSVFKAGSCPALQRTCGNLTPVYESGGGGDSATLALVGGVSDDAAISAYPLDVAVDVTRSGGLKAVRPLPRLDTTGSAAVAFGIGQTLASFRITSGENGAEEAQYVNAVVTGVFPNAVGHMSSVFLSVGRQL